MVSSLFVPNPCQNPRPLLNLRKGTEEKNNQLPTLPIMPSNMHCKKCCVKYLAKKLVKFSSPTAVYTMTAREAKKLFFLHFLEIH